MSDQTSWKQIEENKWSSTPPPDHWPKFVKPISLAGASLFGIHERSGRLYWNGRELQVKQRVSLRWYELILATTGTGAVVASALADWLR